MINPRDFADRHFPHYKVHGYEILPMYCPYCNGGNRHDKYTFALNVSKLTYNCKRGSCGESGSFWKLCKDFGEEYKMRDNYEMRTEAPKVFKKPHTKTKPATTPVEKYLAARGFSRETWERRKVSESNGAIAMPYYENGELVLMKFRPSHKVEKGEKKSWCDEGGKPVFWGMDECDPSLSLVIVEGEMDALALDEAGVENVVSVPFGVSNLECVELCWDWLNQFNCVVIWSDNDEPGRKLQRDLINRLGEWRCLVVKNERKDANEVLLFDGKEAVKKAVAYAVEVPVAGVVKLADVEEVDYSNIIKIRSNLRGIDKALGGFMVGMVTVWTGNNGSGKSTLLGQLMVEAIEQGFSVGAYSGELKASLFRQWIDLQAAGFKHLESYYDDIREKEVYRVKKELVRYIRDWYRYKFFLLDSIGYATEDSLFGVFEYLARKYGCKVFMIDNLMTTIFSDNEKDYLRKQSDFVGRAIKFAQKFDVHVHLVAHPRKIEGRPSKIDISGTGDITNRADNVISVYRLNEEEKASEGYDTLVEILKDRIGGAQDSKIKLDFDPNGKRFALSKAGTTFSKDYSWVNLMPKQGREITPAMFGEEVTGIEF